MCIAAAVGIGLSSQVYADRLNTELIQPIEPAVITEPEKVELGKKPWFEPRSQTVSRP
jgi:cytochrome c peroxidase